EKNTIQKIKDRFDNKKVDKKIEQLKRFILKNHIYLGKGKPLPVYSFIKDLGRMPILVPKSLKVVLKGLERDLVYLLNFEPGSFCPFLKDNLCSIHEIKPNVCRNFPYDKNGELKIDEYFIKICKGLIKKNSKE
ncbi:MAG: YkgJ family cysteine cluster protein, partial [Candidatus Hermodarchaeota archaeon]